MSRRLVIWTVQRTGGTNLAQGLASTYGLPVPPADPARPTMTGPHEPFERARAYGWVATQWERTRDRGALRAAVDEIAATGVFVKHCVDTTPLPVSLELAQATVRHGYAHLVLHRRSALDRMLSFHHARFTRRWFPSDAAGDEAAPDAVPAVDVPMLVTRERGAIRRLAKAVRVLRRKGVEPVFLAFEDVFVSPGGAGRLAETLAALGMSRGAGADSAFAEAIVGQGAMGLRDAYARVPGVDALRAALDDLTPFGPDTIDVLAGGDPRA